MKFIHEKAVVEGDVELSEGVSIMPGAVLRGDYGKISIGPNSNIQDNCVIHEKTTVGELVSVGHGAILHKCKIGNRVVVGMNATVLDNVEIEDDVIIAAGSVVPPGNMIPSNSLVMGIPGKVVRELKPEEKEYIIKNAKWYVEKFCKG